MKKIYKVGDYVKIVRIFTMDEKDKSKLFIGRIARIIQITDVKYGYKVRYIDDKINKEASDEFLFTSLCSSEITPATKDEIRLEIL